ncbi:MAG: acetyl-CoA hydrolase/transferase C-terminal domain-containing protein [Tissierellia bacterium]|nr:acetyl-CoA hydrolase/transferase C-terminal domain-containing protein [Tissierellia bacterium]
MDIKQMYESKKMSAREALKLIKDKDCMIVGQVASSPTTILNELQVLKDYGVKDTIMVSCLPVENWPAMEDPEMLGVCEQQSWFFNAKQREMQKIGLCSDIPQHSTSAVSKKVERCRAEGRDLVLMTTCSPMDENGYLTLSISAVYEKEVIEAGAKVIIEVSPHYPRTFGDTLVHISEVDALVESDRPVPEIQLKPFTEKDAKIGKYIADLVEDGSTIQLGIGNIPNAVAQELKGKKHLGIHTEMFTETMVDLIECGAVDNSKKEFYNGISLTAFTFGSRRLYDFIDNNPSIAFVRGTVANNPYDIARVSKYVSVNAALECDLTGQCASESIGHVQYTGTGGQADTVQGSQRSKGGKSIMAFHSTYYEKNEAGEKVLRSKIVPELRPGAIVSLQRNDTDYVVTEYGVAWLKGATVPQRVEALIGIAHPDFRDWLREEAIKNGLIQR